jgi:hypothetical protein
VTTGGVMQVATLLGVPHGMTWKGVFVDAGFRAIETVGGLAFDDGTNPQKLFMQLSALQGSYLESRVLEEDFQVGAVSTARLMGLAAAQSIDQLRIDSTNIDTLLPGLNLPDNLAADITAAVGANLTVRIPAQMLSFEDWTGTGYIKENPDTGEAGYMLTGMIAGGMTAWSRARWSVDYLNPLTEPYAGEINDDPSAAVEIIKIGAADLQEGTVGEPLAQPLQVLVRDSRWCFMSRPAADILKMVPSAIPPRAILSGWPPPDLFWAPAPMPTPRIGISLK